MLRRLREWLRPGPSEATSRPTATPSSSPSSPASRSPSFGSDGPSAAEPSRPRPWPPEGGQGSTPSPADPFDSFARALGIEVPPEPLPLSEEERAEDARVAALVRERFAAARPEPSSFPAIALQILNHAADPGADVQELARLVARDPALSAGVLSVANSALYRGVMEVETVRDAVARLGLDELGKVAAAVSAQALFSPRQRAVHQAFAARFADLFGHAVAVGSAAAAAALREPGARADRAYLGGLLHDVGKSLALRALAGLVLDGRLPAPPPARVERVLDELHVELGSEAHQIWALPHYLTVLCVRHHDEAIPADAEFVDLHLVRLASALAHLRAPVWAARAARELVQSAGALQLDPFAVRALAAELRQAEARAERAFGPVATAAR